MDRNLSAWRIQSYEGEEAKTLLRCVVHNVDDSRSELQRKTFPLLSYVFLQYSRARWSHQLPCTNTQPEPQEREQGWKQREPHWLSGITDWIHPNLLSTELEVVQIKLHRYPQAELWDASSKNHMQCNTSSATATVTWVPNCQQQHPLSDPLDQADWCNMVIKWFWK